MTVLDEVLRMVLEIINSALSHQLVYCPNLVYTLLYKRHVFEAFRSNPAFQDIIQNIDMVIGFFTSRLQRVQGKQMNFILYISKLKIFFRSTRGTWSRGSLRSYQQRILPVELRSLTQICRPSIQVRRRRGKRKILLSALRIFTDKQGRRSFQFTRVREADGRHLISLKNLFF